MQDHHEKLEKLLVEAEDCELIARMAVDLKKRAFFAKLAVQLRTMARDLEGAMADRAKANDNNAA
jgi:hypothetical protein